MEEKLLEIEEKEDNHIAYLETHLEGLPLPNTEDQLLAECQSANQTLPPLTPMTPTPSYHVKITNSLHWLCVNMTLDL